jgi:glycolate oxidase FAD binding subunit
MITRAASAVVPRLEALLDPECVATSDLGRWSVEEITPVAVVRPADAEQIAATLRLCAEHGASVVPCGGGTAMSVGNLPRAVDIVLHTERLATVVEHDHQNLTITAQAGISLGALDAALAAHHQFLPLEPPHAEAATAGGAIAVNLNGPRRMRYGSARDFVIGMRAALPDGTVIRAGGKTVKNVAGYEMGRLFVGSLGTLGVLTEVTFKVSPLPEASRTMALWARGPAALSAVADQIFASALVPSAVALVNPRAARLVGRDGYGLLVRAEGVEPAVARHERDVSGWASAAGLDAEILAGGRETALWQTVRDFWWKGESAAVRLSVPPGATTTLLDEVRLVLPESAGLAADLGTGTIWVGFDAPATAAPALPGLRALVERAGGNLLAARAPREVKALADVWSPSPPPRALEVMRDLKQSFDPHHILNPGRFVAGL